MHYLMQPVQQSLQVRQHQHRWLWNLKEHHTCVEIVKDEFYSEDIYWLLGMCYPWGDNEFKTEDECRQAIIDTFEGLVSTDDIDFESIENGG